MSDTYRRYACKLIRVVDGDTLEVTIDLGFEVYIKVTVRLSGVDAPELGTTHGRQAKASVIAWFGDLNQVHTLRSFSLKDKYGRRICDVEHADPNQGLLSTWLLENGLATPWPRPRQRVDDPWKRGSDG